MINANDSFYPRGFSQNRGRLFGVTLASGGKARLVRVSWGSNPHYL